MPTVYWPRNWHLKLTQLGAIASFLFLIAGASRLARFNITGNPQPSNPGRPGKKYFVGMPIPAGAGVDRRRRALLRRRAAGFRLHGAGLVRAWSPLSAISW